MSTKLALILAIVCGFIAAIAMNSWMQEAEMKQVQETMPLKCLAARRKIRKGQALKESDLVGKLVPKDLMASNMIPWAERLSYIGKLAEADLDQGNLILSNLLSSNRSASVDPRTFVRDGMRAVTIPVDQVSGVAGLIRPGDYVDVIGSFEIEKNRAALDAARGNTALVADIRTVYLLQAAKVLAVDRQVIAGQGEVSRRSRSTYRTVTLEVRPEDSLRLINAKIHGKVQLLLRNPGEAEIVKGIQEVHEGTNTVRQRPTDYWSIGTDIEKLPPYDGGQ